MTIVRVNKRCRDPLRHPSSTFLQLLLVQVRRHQQAERGSTPRRVNRDRRMQLTRGHRQRAAVDYGYRSEPESKQSEVYGSKTASIT